MEAHGAFLPLLIVVFLAFLVPLVFARLKNVRVPVVVGEILAGMIVGRSGLRLVANDDPLLTLLAQFGFVFLMFISGMEVDFSNLGRDQVKSMPRDGRQASPLVLAGLVFAATLAMSAAIGVGLTQVGLTKNPFIMALILSTTSLGVVLPVLKESGLSSGRYGQVILLSALIADFATMLLITMVVATLSHGLALDLLFIGVLFVAFVFMYRFGFLVTRIPGVRRAIEELEHATTQIKVRATFTLMLIFIVLSEALGTEIILGAFLAGVIIALIRTPDDVELAHKLEAIGFGFFIPIFFINVGINFDLGALFASQQALALVPLIMIAAIVVKSVPALILKLNYSTRQTLAAGVLLSARLSLIIAVAEIGRELGLILDSVNSAVILVAVTTVTFAPIIFMRLVPGRASTRERLMVVVGLGDLGQRVAEELRAHYEHVAAVDNQVEHVARARQRGIDAIHASVELDDPAAAPILDRAYALLCTYGDSELNYRACQIARTTYGIEHIVAHVSNPVDLPRFTQLGVVATNAVFDSAAVLVMLMRNRAAYQLLTRTDDDKEVFEVPVFSEQFVGKMLRQLSLPGDVLILAIRRDGELLVPHGDTRLNANDYLTLIGSTEHVTTAQQLVSNGQVS